MGYSQQDIVDYFDLFTSNPAAYGHTVVGDIVDGKAQSKSELIHKELSPAVIAHHLNGDYSVGAAPLLPDSTVRWCAIDLDDYPYNIYDIVDTIEELGIPLVPCLSKSRKLHIYCFFSEPVDAEEAQNLLRRYLGAFRCSAKTEIFPKQNHTSTSNRFYSWINLPYFDANDENNWRKAVIGVNEFRSLSDFITVARARRLSLADHKSFQESLPYFGAPPCIFSGAVMRDVAPGTRNQWFFNVACYLRMEDEGIDLEDALLELNSTLKAPLPEREIRTTVAKVQANTYYYQCSGMAGCDKALCKGTDKGIGNTTKTTGFDFGQLTKILTDPIQWKWTINGQDMIFHSTKEIMNQTKCQQLCMEKLNDTFYTVSNDKWIKLIRRALASVVEEEVDVRGDFGTGSKFVDVLAQFFAGGRRRATHITQVYNDKVYLDVSTNTYVFTAQSLITYTIDKHKVAVTPNEIRERIVQMGAVKDGNLWRIAVADAPIYNKPADLTITYQDTEGQEDGSYNF